MFVIGGMARSGTNFLGKALNDCSESWHVERENFDYFPKHAPDFFNNDHIKTGGSLEELHVIAYLEDYRGAINTYFTNKDKNFGHVSPQFTYLLGTISNLMGKGFLIRHPFDVMISLANRDNDIATKSYNKRKAIEQTMFYFCSIDDAIKNKKYKYWKFEDITTDKNTIANICDWAGIKDADLNKIDLSKKVNSKEDHKQPKWFTNISEFMAKSQIEMLCQLDSIVKNYYEETVSDKLLK